MARDAVASAKPGPFQRLQDFIKDVNVELGKVTWPTRDDLKVSTKVTLFMLLVMAGIIFVFDKVFQFGVVGILQLVDILQ